MRNLFTALILALASFPAVADVTVSFANDLPAATVPGLISLDFTVDGLGNVELDASAESTDAAVIAAVDAWDGPVGSVSYDSAFGTSFSIEMNGNGNARLTTEGNLGGLGVEGQNQNKLDRPGIEELYASPIFDGFVAALDVKSIEWTGASGGVAPEGERAQVDTPSGTYVYPTDMSDDGSWDLSASNVYVNAGESLIFGNDNTITNAGSGYALAGFSFDLKAFEGDATLTTTFTDNPGNAGGLITNVFTMAADGTATASTGNTALPTEGLLAGATGSFDWTWVPVDLFDDNAITGRVGTGWAYNGGDDAYGPLTISGANINLSGSQAVIMTITTNSLALPSDRFLRLDNMNIRSSDGNHVFSHYDASEDSVSVLTGDASDQYPAITTSAVGGIQTLNVIVEDGDKIAMWANGGGQIRLMGYRFSVAEIKMDTDVPGNVTATALDTAVQLDWDEDASGVPLDFYSVYRSLSSGVTSNDFYTNLTADVLLDLAVTNGTEYFYAVTSTGTNGNESALSAEVSAIPQPASTNIVLIQHLDATNGGSITTNGSGEVSVWADISGNGNDAVDGAGDPVLWPSASLSGSGLAGVDVRTTRANIMGFNAQDAASFLDFSSEAALNSGFSVLVAFKADFVFQDNTRNIVMGTQENQDGGVTGFGLRYDRGKIGAFLNSSGINTAVVKNELSDLPVVDGDTIVMAFTYKASDGLMSLWDSKNLSVAYGTAAAYGTFSGETFYLAGSGNGGQFMDGMIGEVQIFSTTMSEVELVSRGEALSAKWGAEEGSGFDVWAGMWGVDIGTQTNDYDFDGLDNLAEYALNGNPTNAADRGQLSVTGGSGVFKYVYASNAADAALTYTFIDTANLQFPGTPGTNTYISSEAGPTVEGYTTMTNTYDASSDTLFVELEIQQD